MLILQTQIQTSGVEAYSVIYLFYFRRLNRTIHRTLIPIFGTHTKSDTEMTQNRISCELFCTLYKTYSILIMGPIFGSILSWRFVRIYSLITEIFTLKTENYNVTFSSKQKTSKTLVCKMTPHLRKFVNLMTVMRLICLHILSD